MRRSRFVVNFRFLKFHGVHHLNKKSSTGHTALHEASANGHITCVEWLIRFSACKPVEKDVDGCNSLHLASKYVLFAFVFLFLRSIERFKVVVCLNICVTNK